MPPQQTSEAPAMPRDRPRARFTTRRLMALVAALALVMVGVRAFARRPHPTAWFSSAAYYVSWSDGSSTVVPGGKDPLDIRYHGPVVVVWWPSGWPSVYWRSPNAYYGEYQPEPPPTLFPPSPGPEASRP